MAFARLLFRTLLIVLILLLAIGLLLPSQAVVERRISIKAPAPQVFAQINNLRNFHAWSPWSASDPGTQYQFEGPQQGVGARMLWSNPQAEAGGGSLEITHSQAPTEVETRMNFANKGHAITTFVLTPQPDGVTEVAWRFQTQFGWDLFGRYLGLMFDGMIGRTYATGLQTLKQRVEAQQ